MVNKDKIVRAEIFDMSGRLIVSTKTLEFPKDFFSLRGLDFVVFKSNEIMEVPKGEKVEAVFYYRNGTRVKYTTKIDLATDFQVNVHLGSEYVVLEERRRYYKTEANIPGYIKVVFHGDEVICPDPPVKVNIVNINLGGVFIASPYELSNEDRILLSFLDGAVEVTAEILRVQCDDGGNIAGYGCQFEKLAQSEEEALSRFIFDCQLAQRERERGRI